ATIVTATALVASVSIVTGGASAVTATFRHHAFLPLEFMVLVVIRTSDHLRGRRLPERRRGRGTGSQRGRRRLPQCQLPSHAVRSVRQPWRHVPSCRPRLHGPLLRGWTQRTGCDQR